MVKKEGRKVFHIIHNKNDEDTPWRIKLENQEKLLGLFKTQEETIKEAKKIAKKQPLSQIKPHGKDEKFQDESTCGNDLHPPKG
jgi:hypothetical protein